MYVNIDRQILANLRIVLNKRFNKCDAIEQSVYRGATFDNRSYNFVQQHAASHADLLEIDIKLHTEWDLFKWKICFSKTRPQLSDA